VCPVERIDNPTGSKLDAFRSAVVEQIGNAVCLRDRSVDSQEVKMSRYLDNVRSIVSSEIDKIERAGMTNEARSDVGLKLLYETDALFKRIGGGKEGVVRLPPRELRTDTITPYDTDLDAYLGEVGSKISCKWRGTCGNTFSGPLFSLKDALEIKVTRLFGTVIKNVSEAEIVRLHKGKILVL